MIQHSGGGILLDIEGTTSSISYVFDVLFPYAKQHAAEYLRRHRHEPHLQQCVQLIPKEASTLGWNRPADRPPPDDNAEVVADAASWLMQRDAKTTGLKMLQGFIWQEGYAAGHLVSEVFDDVPDALARFSDSGIDVRIYSSGSVLAQQQFFQHTRFGDLRRWFKGFYDTTTGPKRESSSYRKIAEDFALPADQLLFVSDVVEELDAAAAAGLQTALAIRPGNPPQDNSANHPGIKSLDDISISAARPKVPTGSR